MCHIPNQQPFRSPKTFTLQDLTNVDLFAGKAAIHRAFGLNPSIIESQVVADLGVSVVLVMAVIGSHIHNPIRYMI